GYRNFIFFVNSTNIIEKTKANFLTVDSSKYLFNQKIIFDHTVIQVNEVDNFEAVNPNDINILFTTIQGLHSRLNNPSENAITFEELAGKELVLLSDEAHHINTLTKQSVNKTEEELESSWEYTVNKIFQSNPQNIMLEYTATIELSHPAVREKYNDKILVQYTLKEFREDFYSKEIKVLQSDIDSKERILHAIILSQYRRKVAENHGLFLKPVILIKSRTIAESEQAEKDFYEFMKNLKTSDITDLKINTRSTLLKRAFKFFNANSVTDHNLLLELKEDFREEKCLGINSQNDSLEKQLIVNSLEDEDNGIRVVFSVDKLKEGWDVLNLFDIVRLDESKGTKSTTISEAQLIGRGARYFPFQLENTQERFKRKFDEDTFNELRCLEELYYHSINHSEYIRNLKDELVKSGIMEKDSRQRELFVKVKPEIKKTKFWNEGYVFKNERIKYDRKKIKSFSDLALEKKIYPFDFGTGSVEETAIFVEDSLSDEEKKTQLKPLHYFGETICRKALDKIPFYRFDNLKSYFPNLTSIHEFITSSNYSSDINVFLKGSAERISNLNLKDKLKVALKVYTAISNDIIKNSHTFEGTKAFEGYPVYSIVKDRTQHIVVKDGGDQQYGFRMSETRNDKLRLNLSEKEWYVHEDNFGTSEEKFLIRFINDNIDQLKQKYDDLYLLRNEGCIILYRFSDGAAIEPDFVLFLTEKETDNNLSYQIFIEPKGEHLMKDDKWKEEILSELRENYYIDPSTIYESDKFRLVGLPFFNNKDEYYLKFKESFEGLLGY
ncbi:MAG: DEAD/DEAH box helicase family protein, partial [Candidatus Marinimicrobia bacterium]|nr:DEAD/DEAH box helicase family protein [Candidatus Neomarinimicrobiota bacterium]